MTFAVEPAAATPLAELAEIATRAQQDPDRYVAYFADDPAAIAAEVAETGDWAAATVVARRDDRIVGWLLAETDGELGRVWWWGPVVAPGEPWAATADALYGVARRGLGDHLREEELAVDARSSSFAAFAARHGFRPEEASALFRLTIGDTTPDRRVRPIGAGDTEVVAALHDRLFPGTHTTGNQLVNADRTTVHVATAGSGPIGYVATEVQPDGDGYIDFLGVDPDHRGRGTGRALVATALDALRRRGAETVSLTMREANVAADRLYRGLGFDRTRVLRPYRVGFSLDPDDQARSDSSSAG